MNRRPEVSESLIDAIFVLKTIESPMAAVASELTAEVVTELLGSKGIQRIVRKFLLPKLKNLYQLDKEKRYKVKY